MANSNTATEAAKEIGIGMLGCGFIGRCHTNAYKKIPYIYAAAKLKPRLAMLCETPQLAEREAARYGYEAFCSDWKDLVSDPRVEVFDNCAPTRCIPSPALPPCRMAST